ncbi:uncharacterized protein CIMG_13542 [Coccidioides immitis RS]|uniref:Uncharacterized protein n=1 Tax=Coccidioides immitis (strain RS) TaxID=246410 RepID=A0A0D8JWE9_COCIM|nr:uncharacterized protein CIMG_13542 [Coccidioides immitis RS]KJF61256.1 hypothetical protein CIMG_13542 [Coccidioides immitis RS]
MTSFAISSLAVLKIQTVYLFVAEILNNQTKKSELSNAVSLSDISDTLSDTLSDTYSEPEDIRVQKIIQEAVAALFMKLVDNNELQQYEEPESEFWLQTILYPVHLKVLQISEDISILRSLLLGLSMLKKKYRAQFSILSI